MKLSRLYSNDSRFHEIPFNDGLNVVLGKVSQRYDMHKDSHNLGKSTLIEVLDFMMLKDIDKNHFFKKYNRAFGNHVFYLEILLNTGTFLTIRRCVATPTKIAFKNSETSAKYSEKTDWDECSMTLKKAQDFLNAQLAFDVLPEWNYRKTISFFLRTQKDYVSVFQLGKFINGKHKDWKPVVFELLGYDSVALIHKYELDQQLEDLKDSKKSISTEMSVNADDYDKVKSALDLKFQERDELRRRVDVFSFYAEEQTINRNLVEEIEREISELNSREYALSYDLEQTKTSIENLPTFDIEQLKKIYEEVDVFFPDSLTNSFDDLYQFNIKVTQERNQYLREQVQDLETEVKWIRAKLQVLDGKRNDALSALQDKDTFHKFKEFQKKLAQLEGEVSRLELQLRNIDVVASLNEKIESVKQEQNEVGKEIATQLKRQNSDIPMAIKSSFNEIFRTVFGVSALLYVRPNSAGNVEFECEVAPDENAAATAEGYGNTYNKMLCVAFDLAVLAAYSSRSFFRFVYHDGVFEGLDNRKKELFIQVARNYCQKYGLQYIFSSIEDDVPTEILASFTKVEMCLELNDSDDKGKLFGFSF